MLPVSGNNIQEDYSMKLAVTSYTNLTREIGHFNWAAPKGRKTFEHLFLTGHGDLIHLFNLPRFKINTKVQDKSCTYFI